MLDSSSEDVYLTGSLSGLFDKKIKNKVKTKLPKHLLLLTAPVGASDVGIYGLFFHNTYVKLCNLFDKGECLYI